MGHLATLDIEIYDTEDKSDNWAQAKYLVHGYDDVFWTDDIDDAMEFMKSSAEKAFEDK